MFSSNPLDKSGIGPDCTSGRNASNRFPMGITSLGDENQQIRIQLAVHKYNSSANSSLNNKYGVTSPFRHSFLNNSLKAKCYEGETEGASKNGNRNGNQYEGVGAFPTIHLKKSAIRYRPIRRFNDVKVSYPELPVNRFLSNLPEPCPDVKSSTRSVLDVLEDLSGKKIHSKDESGSSKQKSKGLGGDYLINQNSVYKPLFVQKPKISTVLTRDNTTQTSSVLGAETPQNSNLFVINDTSDPRAELRRKLAKQNNEIFASLSSSVSSNFSLKRKIDKVTPSAQDESLTDGSLTKNPRIDNQLNYNGNGVSRSVNRSKTNISEAVKLSNRKSRLKESSSPTSPNKDRLTTIFLDMQSASGKVQIFQNNATLSEIKPAEDAPQSKTHLNNGFTHTSNGFSNNVSNSPVQCSVGNSTIEEEKVGKDLKNSSSLDLNKTSATDLRKPEIDEVNKPAFNFPVNKTNSAVNNVTKSTTETFQFGANTNTSNLGITKPSTESEPNSDAATKINKSDNKPTEKREEENPVPSKPFAFGTSDPKPNFSSFKFGASDNAALSASPKGPQSLISEPASSSTTSVPSSTPSFSFVPSCIATSSVSQSFPIQFNAANAQNTFTTPSKPLFAFGQNASPTKLSLESNKTEEKVIAPNTLTASVATTTTHSIQSSAFKFGEKSIVDSAIKTVAGQTVVSEAGPSPPTAITFPSGASSLTTKSETSVQASKPVFSFGQKAETSTTSTTSGITNQEPKFAFTFGQKPDVAQRGAQEEPKNTNLFSFGQKSIAGESQSAGVLTNVASPGQPATTQTTALEQNASVATSTPQMKFQQILVPPITNTPEGSVLGGISTSAFTQSNSFPLKNSPFSSSANGFGTSTTQTSTALGTSSSVASGFSFGVSTTQTTPSFGVSTTTQSMTSFGGSSATQTSSSFGTSTSQPISGFGGSTATPSTSVFGTSVSAPSFGISAGIQSTSTFPVSSTTQSGPNFGVASTTQSLSAFKTASVSQSSPSFGITSTTQSTTTFGVTSTPQSTLGFGACSTTQSSTAFAASTGFGAPASSQPNAAFGTPTATQSAVRFGAPVAQNSTSFGATGFSSTQPSTTFGSAAATSTSAFGASQSSFSQSFNNKPTASLRPTTAVLGQNPNPSFSSGTTFNANQSNVFGQKPNPERDVQIQSPGFGATSQTFGNQNKFGNAFVSFSTSNATGFTTSPPNTTSAPVFSFGGSTTSNTFTFGGGGGSMAGNTQTPFAFKSPTNEPFKFGASTTKEGSGFGGNPATFAFGQMNNNNSMNEQKPAFSFGSPQVSSSAPFAFGTTPSPSVFSFGGSTSGSSGSGFNFGTPTPGGAFGQTPASPGAPFPVPGTFSIGSGSSQSRPRATSRPRRRP